MFKQAWWVVAVGGLVFGPGVALGASTAPVASAAPAASETPEQNVRLAIARLSPTTRIDSITPAPLPGFYQVIAAGQMLYVSADGRYMLNGNLIDLGKHQNVSDNEWAAFRKAELAKVPAAQRIVFAPPHPKYTISVFTDVNCGFCRALHEQIGAFNKAGIAVEYLAWPREGVTTTAGRPTPTYTEMVSVWCAADRKAAFTEAKQGHAPKPATCTNPVKDQFDLGVRLGVSGTPTIFGPDGSTLGGYVTPQQLLMALQGDSNNQ